MSDRVDPVTCLAAAGVVAAATVLFGPTGLVALPLALAWLAADTLGVSAVAAFVGAFVGLVASLGCLTGWGAAGAVMFRGPGGVSVLVLVVWMALPVPALRGSLRRWRERARRGERLRDRLAHGLVFGASAGAVVFYAVVAALALGQLLARVAPR